ncbi:MAG: hypothetical protein JJU15_04625 [Pararhodobacter sp.]|nr:hypothetical protein [Pararhodobacter sp.]
MKPKNTLSDFVRDGLREGHSPDELRDALARAGWQGADIDAAMAVWVADGLRLPVPRPQPSVMGRALVMFGLFAITLVVVIWHVVQLSFALIDIWLPEPDRHAGGWAQTRIRWSMATLFVVLPLFAWLTWRVELTARQHSESHRAPIELRFGAMAVLVSILVLISNAVAVVYAALSGNLTAQFLAKAGVVSVVAVLLIAWFRTPVRKAP